MRIITFAALYLGFLSAFAAAAQNTQQKVDQIFAAYNKIDSAGCSLGVIQDGSFIYRKGYGAASIELGVPLSPASVFYMGSISKQFTAASIVLAAEQGFLSLDDDIRKYIPELPNYGHTITLRQMLHHTSGLKDFLTLLNYAGRDPASIHSDNEIIDLIAHQKSLNNIPGDEFIYSNTNYYLLGQVVKRATGKPLAEFAAENIFRPLGMAGTRYYDDHHVVLPGRVSAYDTGAGGKFLVDWSTSFDIVGAGGLMSNVDDLLLWDRNFYANRLGKGTLLKELQTPGVLNSGKPISYALGLELGSYRGLSIVEHDGALYGYRNEILRFPEQRFTVVCLCNLSDAAPSKLARKVAGIYLEKNLKAGPEGAEASNTQPPPGQKTAEPHLTDAELAAYTGRFRSTEIDATYDLSVAGGSLMLRLQWNPPLTLKPTAPDQFEMEDLGTIVFQRNASHQVTGLSVSSVRARNVLFEKITAP